MVGKLADGMENYGDRWHGLVFEVAPAREDARLACTAGGSGGNPIVSTVLTQFGFDGNGNQIRMVDSNSGTTVWAFDTLDRKISETYQNGSSREFAYDLANDVVTYTDENGSVFSNTWDCMGRKTDVAIAPASGIGGTTSQSFQYDGLNRSTLNQDITSGGTALVTFFYDSLGTSIEEAPTTLGTSRYVTNTAFTSVPATQFEYPNNRLVNSNYDVLYRRKQIIEQATSVVIASWQFFGPGRIATVTLGNGLVCSNMNNAQSRSAIQSGLPTPGWGSIATDQLGYDGAGRMIGKRFFNGANVIVGFTSAYDMSSNKLFERPLHSDERSSLYDSYDSMNRLLDYQRGVLASGGGSITTPIALPNTDQSRNYNLDALGNWTSSVYTPEGTGSAITDQRNHNKLNQITLRSVGGTTPTYFSYDGASGASNGNLTNDGTFYYQYDALNRPIAITTVHGKLVGTYVYDAMNRRVRKTVTNGGLPGDIPNGTTDYIYLGNQVVEERNAGNTPIRQYLWGTYVDELIQLITLVPLGPQSLPAGAYYLLQDLLYRAVALTNSSGSIVEAYDTDAYGNTLIFTAPGADGIWFTDDDVQSNYGANEIIYCGYRYDPEGPGYYVRNRNYIPFLGRWLQRDPIGYAGGVNLYEYVEGRAVNSTDAAGLLPALTAGRGCMSTVTVASDTPDSVAAVLRFVPSRAVVKRCLCKKIVFVQYVKSQERTWFGVSASGWQVDTANPYPHQDPWTPGKDSASMFDNPGRFIRGTNITFWPWWLWTLSMNFKDSAYCAEGKEAGKVYGTAEWGFEIDKYPRPLGSVYAQTGGVWQVKFGQPGSPQLGVAVTGCAPHRR